MFWLLGGAIVLLVGAVGGLIYYEGKIPPKALVGLTAAGAVIVLPYTITSDADVGVSINPATGAVTTTVNGIGVDPSNGSMVVGGMNTGSGMPVIEVLDMEGDEYLAPRKRDMASERLALAGVDAKETTIDAPAGFRKKRVPALVVEPEPGETPETTLRRVEEALADQEIETERFEAKGGGAIGRLGF